MTGLLTATEACRYLRCGETYLRAHATEIGVVRKGRRVGYRQSDLDAWLAAHVVKATPPEAPSPSGQQPSPRLDWVTRMRQSDGINAVTRRPYREGAMTAAPRPAARRGGQTQKSRSRG